MKNDELEDLIMLDVDKLLEDRMKGLNVEDRIDLLRKLEVLAKKQNASFPRPN